MALVYGKGTVAQEPFLHYNEQGNAFAVVVARETFMHKGEEKNAGFHKLIAFGDVAERLAELNEGDDITEFKGRLQYRPNDYYTSENGKSAWMAEIIVNEFTSEGGTPPEPEPDEEEDMPF